MSSPFPTGDRARRLALTSGVFVLTGALLAASAATAAAGPAVQHPGGTSVAATAQALGLSAQEELVVKDVIKDADGTVHTRYERTYAGLAVVGGDLVVHRAGDGTIKDVTKAVRTPIKIASLDPKLTPTAATSAAIKTAKAAKTAGAATSDAPARSSGPPAASLSSPMRASSPAPSRTGARRANCVSSPTPKPAGSCTRTS